MIIQEIVAWLLGPSGKVIADWYADHNLLCNGIVVLLGLLAIFLPRQRERVMAVLRDWYEKSPLARSEEDQRAFDRAEEHRRAKLEERERNRKEKREKRK